MTDGFIKIYEPVAEYDKYEYKYELDGKDVFCFSHDPRPFASVFSSAKILRKGINTTTGAESDWIPMSIRAVKDFTVVTADGGYDSPASAFNGLGDKIAYTGIALKVSFEDEGNKVVLDAESGFKANAFIGVKGDSNLDGVCNANDATAVLKYAAAVGIGVQDEKPLAGLSGNQLALAMFLSDVDDEADTDQTLNAKDATAQLKYAAKIGTITEVNDITKAQIWSEVLDPLPKYSKEIAAYVEKLNN